MARIFAGFAVLVLFLSCSAATSQTTGDAAAPRACRDASSRRRCNRGCACHSAQSTATTTESPEITQFQKIEDAWSDAVNLRDQYGLELVLSPLFVDVSASGDITTRNQQLAQLITGEDKTLHLDQRVITVRMLGDIAVANGTYAAAPQGRLGPGGRKGRLHPRLRARCAAAGCASTPSAPCCARTRTPSPRSSPTPKCPSTFRCSPSRDEGKQQQAAPGTPAKV